MIRTYANKKYPIQLNVKIMGIRSYFTSYLKKNVRKWFSIFMSIFYHKICTARLKVRGLCFIICVIGILVFSQKDDLPLYTPGSMKSYDAWTPKPILRLFYLTQCNKYIYRVFKETNYCPWSCADP